VIVVIEFNETLSREMAVPMYLELKKISSEAIDWGEGLSPFEYACYLFFVISIDYGANIPLSPKNQPFIFYYPLRKKIIRIKGADMLWFGLRRMLDDYYQIHKSHDLVTPKCIVERFGENQSELEGLLKGYLRVNFPAESARRWLENAYNLMKVYGGDPRNIPLMPTQISSLRKIFGRLIGKETNCPKFRGFTLLGDRPGKILNFLVISMVREGFWEIADTRELNVALDINVALFSAKTGLVRLPTERQVSISEIYYPVTKAFDMAFNQCLNQEIIETREKGNVGPFIFDSVAWSLARDNCTRSDGCSRCSLARWCEKNIVQTEGRGTNLKLVKK